MRFRTAIPLAVAVASLSGCLEPRSGPTSDTVAEAASSMRRAEAGTATVSLADLDLAHVEQDWGEPRKDRSVDGNPLSIAGRRFGRGLGTHAASSVDVEVRGATRFTASVGVDDDAEAARGAGSAEWASVEFVVLGDGGKRLWRSGVMHKGDAARAVDVPLAGVRRLRLRVTDGGDDMTYDHADWADARFEYGGEPPIAVAPVAAPRGPAVVLTPKSKPEPRINGARTFGARPGSPILITIPCTGERPIAFAVDGLPEGLTLDAARGQITGRIAAAGEHAFVVRATNARGTATRRWRLSVGEGKLAQTPPMGWNSWNVWGMAIDDAKVRAAADAIVSSGLIDHGWTYVNIDDGWQKHREDKDGMTGPGRDASGAIVPNPKFPDMKTLADYVHDKGLKIGLYSSPGPYTCGGCLGSFGHEAADARTYAAWGIDYLKYDWCSYQPKLEAERAGAAGTVGKVDVPSWNDGKTAKERAEFQKPYAVMRDELRRQPRDIVYSLCQYGMDKVWEWGGDVDGQLWRTTGDITDSWRSMSGTGFGQAGHETFAGPGRWNDPDMLVVGHVGWGPNVRPTRLTPDEQYAHVSLWSLLASPLLIGCDLTRLDEFTLGLLTNDEVIDVNQDPLGKQASKVFDDGDREVWAKPLEDGGVAVGLFNRGDEAATVEAKWADLKLPADASREVRDLWRQQSLGASTGSYKSEVAPHGVRLVKIGPK